MKKTVSVILSWHLILIVRFGSPDIDLTQSLEDGFRMENYFIVMMRKSIAELEIKLLSDNAEKFHLSNITMSEI